MLRLIRGTVRWFVVLPMNVVSKVFSVECFICDNLGSIGHLVLEVARPIVMYASFSRKKHIVFVGDKSKAANAYLLSLWESRYPFLNAAGTTLERLSLFSKVYQPRLVQYWYDNHRHIDHVITMFNGPPPIELPEDDVARGYRLLVSFPFDGL